ncbi:MAG TPA: hypothetical protein VEB42_14700, partial [Chitinophagaceae bacterium]|nr:hypothetical protein [Chitinophagaceae bacterium]
MLDLKWLLILGIFLYMNITVCAQDRISNLQQQLNELSQSTAGLNDEVETAVSNTSLYEFLKGLAVSYKLNLNIDPSINEKITTYFSHQTVKSVLLYLARQYDLDFVFTGSIIYITPYKDPSLNLPRP